MFYVKHKDQLSCYIKGIIKEMHASASVTFDRWQTMVACKLTLLNQTNQGYNKSELGPW